MNKIIKEDMEQLLSNFKNMELLNNKTILVTGATGLIAQNLVYFLLYSNFKLKLNIKVLALVRNIEKARHIFKDFECYGLEYLNQDVCDSIVYDGKIDYIFHAAGSCSANAIRNNPVDIIKANTIGTMNVLLLAKEKRVTKVIFPSTREVYGEVCNKSMISEFDMGIVDPVNPRNCYPESKRMAESLLIGYNAQYGVNFNILRIAHVYGPGMTIDNDGRVMSDFIGDVVLNKDIILNSDGTTVRSFCYVTDAILGTLLVMLDGKDGEVYNLSNENEPYAIKDVAQMLIDLYPDKKLKIVFAKSTEETKKGYISYKTIKLDTSRLENLGWKPYVKLKDGLKKTVDYFNSK